MQIGKDQESGDKARRSGGGQRFTDRRITRAVDEGTLYPAVGDLNTRRRV